jgi:hypothetical protein
MTGGEDPAIFLNASGDKFDKSGWTSLDQKLKNLNGYKVTYKHVEYTISNASDTEMTWDDLKGMKSISSTLTGNVKFKKDLIGDAISKIYGVAADFFKKEIAKNRPNVNGEPIDTVKTIDSSTISKVKFMDNGKITVTYKESVLPKDEDEDVATKVETTDANLEIQINNFDKKNWQQKVMDYYLRSINVTSNISELGRPLGIASRAVNKLATGESMDSQLQATKAKRVVNMAEVMEAFQNTTIDAKAFNASTGELRFNATILTDGQGAYTVGEIKVDTDPTRG